MIGRCEAAAFKKSLHLLPAIEKEIDALIKRAIREGASVAKKSLDSEAAAETIAEEYRLLLWKVDVTYTGSDRAYSPKDEWTLTFDLTGL